jgi:hypothetical protein
MSHYFTASGYFVLADTESTGLMKPLLKKINNEKIKNKGKKAVTFIYSFFHNYRVQLC